MKVLLVNGSPNEKGCTYTALQEAARKAGVALPEREEAIFTNFIHFFPSRFKKFVPNSLSLGLI